MNPETKIYKILFWYSLVFIVLNLILGFSFGAWKNNLTTLAAFALVLIYFALKKFHRGKILKIINYLLTFYCYCLISIIWLMNLITAKSTIQIVLGIAFTPLVFYFGLELANKVKILISKVPRVKKPIKPVETSVVTNSEVISPMKISDQNRRQFLKMAGSTGLGLVALSLLDPKKAGATFFGSVPGPGTMSIKDADGNKIDPAARQPTDGYKISKLDDTTSDTYSYYGFVDQIGQWYIQRETTSGVNAGTFLYAKNTAGFTTAWDDRVNQNYASFDSTF